MEDDSGAHAPPIDDDGALQQGMEGDDAGLDQGMGAGDAGIDHGVEEEGMEDGDDGALQDMEGDQGQGMEAGDAGLEEAMEHEDGAHQQDMVEGDDAGIEQEQGMEEEDDDVFDLDQFIEDMGGGVALLPQNHVLPLSIPEYEASPAHLLLQWNEFQRSGPLETIVLLADRDEEDGHGAGPPETVGPLFRDGDYRSIDTILPEWTMELIRETFNARTHATIEALLLDGRRIQLDFLRKICVEVDEEGTPLRTIAMYWVDDQYRVFVSARIFGMDEETVRQRFTEECQGRLIITEVQRCFHRLHAMDPFCERMQVQRPVFGWYGAEAELVDHGAFQDEVLHTNWERVEILGFERAHGRGVHIAPMRRIMKR